MVALLCSVCDARSWLSCSNSFIKMNKSFIMSFGSFNKWNEQIDSENDLFILMNDFEQQSHTEQSKAIIWAYKT